MYSYIHVQYCVDKIVNKLVTRENREKNKKNIHNTHPYTEEGPINSQYNSTLYCIVRISTINPEIF